MISCRITDECVSCGACAGECADSAIVEKNGKYAINDHCTGCGKCVDICPIGAIVQD